MHCGGVNNERHSQTEQEVRDGQVEDEHVGHYAHPLVVQYHPRHRAIQGDTQHCYEHVEVEDGRRISLCVAAAQPQGTV